MISIAIFFGVSLLLIASSWLGRLCARKQPAVIAHPESLEAIRRSITLLTTMTALVLGLLISNGKQSFDTQSAALSSLAAKIALLDQTLAHYGEGASAAREEFQLSSRRIVASLWNTDDGAAASGFSNRSANERFLDEIAALEPRDARQEFNKAEALRLSAAVAEERFRLATIDQNVIPLPVAAAIIAWLSIIFLAHGLTAPARTSVILTDAIVAISAALAIALAVEFDTPFDGLLQVSEQPLSLVLESFG